MPDAAADLVAEFDRALNAFRTAVTGLDDRQWALRARVAGEDDDRTLGLIGYHVAAWLPRHAVLLQARATGADAPPLETDSINAAEATEHANATKPEVLARLDAEAPPVRSQLAALTGDQLRRSWDTPFGPFTVRTMAERVLIGHVDAHRRTIETTIAQNHRDG